MLGAGQPRLFGTVLDPQQVQHAQQQLVQSDRHPRNAAIAGLARNRRSHPLKAAHHLGRRPPYRQIRHAQAPRQFRGVRGRQQIPARPAPVLIRTRRPHRNRGPVQSTSRDARIPLPVGLPGSRDREIAGTQGITLLVDGEAHRTGLEQTDFNPFVAVKVHAPVLIPAGVPVTETQQSRQLVRRKPIARIMAATKAMKIDLPFANRCQQRLVRIHTGGLSAIPKKRRPAKHLGASV
jgi:hypothetical protein